MDTVQWNQSLFIDESYEKLDYQEYAPHTGTDLNNVHGDIRIVIQNQDQFLLPSKSNLYIEGKLLKKDGTNYAKEDDINLIHNGLMYLFDRVAYKLSGREIEGYSHPGVSSTLKGLITYEETYAEGEQFLWNITNKRRKNYIFNKTANLGGFSAIIPLTHIFGFCENYEKVMYGVEHELVLRRNHNNNAIIKSDEKVNNEDKVPDGDIVINKLVWRMPHARLSDEVKVTLYGQIQNKIEIPIAFLNRQCERFTLARGMRNIDWKLNIAAGSEKPRYIVVGLQKNKENKQTRTMATFDNENLTNLYVQLNSERYPEENLDLDFRNNIYVKAYNMLTNYFNNVLGKRGLTIGIGDYETHFPLFLFDVSKQSERLKNTSIDICIKGDFSTPLDADTEMFALILSDRLLRLTSDGNKMNILW